MINVGDSVSVLSTTGGGRTFRTGYFNEAELVEDIDNNYTRLETWWTSRALGEGAFGIVLGMFEHKGLWLKVLFTDGRIMLVSEKDIEQ